MDGVAEGPPAPAKAEGAACALPGTRPGTRASFERPPGAAGRPGPGVVRVSLEAKAEAGPEAQPEAGRPGAAPAAPRGARRAVRSGGRDPGARGEAQGSGSALGRTGGGARPGHGCSGGSGVRLKDSRERQDRARRARPRRVCRGSVGPEGERPEPGRALASTPARRDGARPCSPARDSPHKSYFASFPKYVFLFLFLFYVYGSEVG